MAGKLPFKEITSEQNARNNQRTATAERKARDKRLAAKGGKTLSQALSQNKKQAMARKELGNFKNKKKS